ncbi:MAG TPA: hypothetical protein VGG08_05525 [Solirubrobacteraceae bacterium]|jgi:hypothetical protein
MNNLTPKLLSTVLPGAIVGLLIAGCGGSSSSGNGIGAKSPTEILQATKSASAAAKSVHIAGSIVSGGKPISLNMQLVAGQGGKGTIAQEGFSIDLVQVGGNVYIDGSDAFYKHVAGATAAQLLDGKWLKAPADSGELASLAELTNLSKLIDSALASHGKLSKGKEETVSGQKAIGLKDTTKGGTLYVASTGSPYPVEILKGGSEGGTVTFSDWNKPVTLKAPAGAISISELQSGH